MVCPSWTQFPCLYSACEDMEFSCSSAGRGGDATLPFLPWLCLERTLSCQVVGAGPGQVNRSLGTLDTASLCGPSVTFKGPGQGPDWNTCSAANSLFLLCAVRS